MALDLKVPPPEALEPAEKDALVQGSLARIREHAADADESGGGIDLWMLLIVRMVTRGAEPGKGKGKGKAKEDAGVEGVKKEEVEEEEEETAVVARYAEQDRLRTILYNYIVADFAGRCVACICSVGVGSLNFFTGYGLRRPG
jgi:symplekin